MSSLRNSMLVIAGLVVSMASGAWGQDASLWEKLVERYETIAKEGRPEDAAEMAEAIVRVAEKTFRAEDLRIAQSLDLLAASYSALGQAAAAQSLYQRALNLRETSLGQGDPAVATTLIHQAKSYISQGQPDQAIPLFQRALAIREATHRPRDPDLWDTLILLANFYASQGQSDQAEAYYQRVLAQQRKELGAQLAVATTLVLLGDFYAAQGKTVQVIPLYREAAAIREMVLGADHPAVATTMILLAKICVANGDSDQAEQFYQRAVFIFGKALGLQDPRVVTTLPQTFTKQGFEGRLAPAGAAHQQTMLQVAEALKNRAIVYANLGRDNEAETMLQQSLKSYEKALGLTHPELIDVLERYAALLRKMGRPARAEPLEARVQLLQSK